MKTVKHIRYFLFILLLLPGYTLAGVVGYLEIEGISGEATTPPYQDMIEISGYGQGIDNPISVYGGATGSGRANFSAIRVSKEMDRTSPLLYLRAINSQSIGEVTIHLVSETGYNYFSIRMINARIVSIVPSAGSASATEMLGFKSERIFWTAKPEGQTPITTGWDLTTNTAP